MRENEKAISLYGKMEFELVDESIFLEKKAALGTVCSEDSQSHYRVLHGIPHDVYKLSFWTNSIWDIQWQTIENKEALLVIDREERVIGYALYRRLYDENQALSTILLFQCEARQPSCGCGIDGRAGIYDKSAQAVRFVPAFSIT